MSSDRDGTESGSSVHARRTAERVQDALTEIAEARSLFQEARMLTPEEADVQQIHIQLQAAVVDLHDAIRPFAAEKDEWRQRDILGQYALADIPNLIGTETVTKREETGLRRYQTVEVERPRLIPGGALLEMSYRLEKLAEEVGFEPAPDQSAEKQPEVKYTDVLGN